MARGHAQVLLEVPGGEGFAQPNPRPMFPNPSGLLRVEPHSEGLRDRIWWGAASQQTATWAAELGMNLQSSTLINNEQLKEDEAITAADTLLLTVPNQLGVDYNAHVIDSILTHVAPALGWR